MSTPDHLPNGASVVPQSRGPSGSDCRSYLYLLAWSPYAEDSAARPLVFRHRVIAADNIDAAYVQGQQWAQIRGLLPLPGPGNDYVLALPDPADPSVAASHMADPLRAVTLAGENFLHSIEHAGAAELRPSQRLNLLDEITEWLIRAHCAQDYLWDHFPPDALESIAPSAADESEATNGDLSAVPEEFA